MIMGPLMYNINKIICFTNSWNNMVLLIMTPSSRFKAGSIRELYLNILIIILININRHSFLFKSKFLIILKFAKFLLKFRKKTFYFLIRNKLRINLRVNLW